MRIFYHIRTEKDTMGFQNETYLEKQDFSCVVFIEGLRASQPNGVMSSAVSFPNHTLTIVHILSPETDKCPS